MFIFYFVKQIQSVGGTCVFIRDLCVCVCVIDSCLIQIEREALSLGKWNS